MLWPIMVFLDLRFVVGAYKNKSQAVEEFLQGQRQRGTGDRGRGGRVADDGEGVSRDGEDREPGGVAGGE